MRRSEKLNELIRRELAAIIAREFDVAPTTFITITEVSVSPNTEIARGYISIYPDVIRNNVFTGLANRTGEFQALLNKRLGMRPVPKIVFVLDTRVKEAAHIEELLDEIGKNEDSQKRGHVAK